MSPTTSSDNLLCGELPASRLQQLLAPYHLSVHYLEQDSELTGSFWGDPEAGLVADRLYVKADTPVQSALHEACHYICMEQSRREQLDTNAGGGYDEENAVCYLQIILAGWLPECGQQRMMQDMDSWGYSFRLGSARAWFEQDADDARQWLQRHQLIDAQQQPTWRLRR
ncbi:MAG: hypothetical protein PVF81_03280 [Thioalkalispiraceae bacterium]|jgi:hypothetical protein